MLQLFLSFFKIGLFTFGGGYAMLPLLQDEIVRRRRWATDEELMDYYSIGQCTPGIIAVNVATFIGTRHYGKAGGCLATLAIVLPSMIIITLIAAVLARYMHNEYLTHAFAGIRIAVTALILNTFFDMWKKGVKGYFGYTVFALAAVILFFFNLSAVLIVIAAALTGLLPGIARRKKTK